MYGSPPVGFRCKAPVRGLGLVSQKLKHISYGIYAGKIGPIITFFENGVSKEKYTT